jgi:hypothetical protein
MATRWMSMSEILPCGGGGGREVRTAYISVCRREQMQIKNGAAAATYVAVLVDDAEGLEELVPSVPLPHLVRHHVHELVEVDGAAAVLVHLRDHLLDLLPSPHHTHVRQLTFFPT